METLSKTILVATVLSLTVNSVAKPQYKILTLGPIGSRSLYHLLRSLSEALGDAGHAVTLVSTFGPSSKHPNITEIPTGALASDLEDYNAFEDRSIFGVFAWLKEVTKRVGHAMWSNKNIKSLWEKRNDFDAIIIISYANNIAVPFLFDYNGTYINVCTPGIEWFTLRQHGNWLPLSVTPSIFLPYDESMSFYERLINPWVTWLSYLYAHFIPIALDQTLVDNYFQNRPPVIQLYEDSHLTLINGHFALDGPMPLLPTQVEIGTINARLPKPLPKDLEDFVEDSGDYGVIYFSLGSIVKGKDMPDKYKMMFLEAFRRIPQKIIWKFEDNELNLPSNVLTRSWLPQQDILGHPKTRLFISHCGNLGTQEAKFHGVPILAVPVIFDQPRNAARMARKGLGLVLEWDTMTTDAIVHAIETILNDPSYASKMKQMSEALKDQKESPAERAVWWVEYTIRHKNNSSHLKYAGKDLHFLQYLMADVAVFWILICILEIIFLSYILAKVWKWWCCSKEKRKEKVA